MDRTLLGLPMANSSWKRSVPQAFVSVCQDSRALILCGALGHSAREATTAAVSICTQCWCGLRHFPWDPHPRVTDTSQESLRWESQMASCQLGFYFKPRNEFDYSEAQGDPLGVAVSPQRWQGWETAVSSKQLRLVLLSDGRAEQQVLCLSRKARQEFGLFVELHFLWKRFGVSLQQWQKVIFLLSYEPWWVW